MIYGSVCSGIEAATVAWSPLGWEPAWFSEIDPFCCDLLTHRYPDVYNYGNFTEIGADATPVDLLCGGTPCQDFSVAGLRAGLAGERGSLTIEFLRLAGRLRPRWVFFENVPGILSADGRRAFGVFLGEMGKLGYGWTYRVLDAQYAGVPQRRRRVFVVGYLGDWQPAAAVLFERHSLQRNTAPSREKREDVAGTIGGGSGSRGWCPDTDRMTFVPDVCPTLRAGGNRTGGDRPPGTDVDTCDSLVPVYVSEVAYGLNAHPSRIDGESETFVAHTFQNTGQGWRNDGPVAQSLRDASAGGASHANLVAPSLTHATLDAHNGSRRHNGVIQGMAVRRLTPRECERLQGFPDDYTLIPRKGGKLAADGPRYKAIGNSWPIPVIAWIGSRIQTVDDMVIQGGRRAA